MKEMSFVELSEPRFETRPEFVIAGLGERFTFDKNEGIVGLWQAFIPYLGNIPGQTSYVTYGLCCNPGEDGSFEYIAGVEVPRVEGLPPALRHFKVPRQDYAVFRHLGHISTIHQTFLTIFNKWLPESGYAFADAPEFERYSADFEPMEGRGSWRCGCRWCGAAKPRRSAAPRRPEHGNIAGFTRPYAGPSAPTHPQPDHRGIVAGLEARVAQAGGIFELDAAQLGGQRQQAARARGPPGWRRRSGGRCRTARRSHRSSAAGRPLASGARA